MDGNIRTRLKERARKLKTDIPAIYISLKEKDTPLLAKVLAGMTVAYALSPIDFIPDFIPILGYLDDIILLPLLVALTIRFIPTAILEKSRQKAIALWENGPPKKWGYALPIIAIWVLLLGLIAKAIWL